MLNEEEKKVAERILQDEGIMKVLEKIFTPDEYEKLSPALLNEKTNEELGEMIRANILAEQKIRQRFDTLKNQKSVLKKPKTVPR